MPATLESAKQGTSEENAQIVLDQLTNQEITDEQAQERLEKLWGDAYRDTVFLRILRALFPSLGRYHSR